MLRLSEHPIPAKALRHRWAHLKDVPLHECKDVRPLLLIGSDHPELVVPMESRFGPEGAPVAVRTELGWAVQGPTMNHRHRGELNYMSGPTPSDSTLHEGVCKLWHHDFKMYAERKQVTRSKQDQRAIDLLEAKSTYVEVDGIRRVATLLLWRQDDETSEVRQALLCQLFFEMSIA